MKRKWSNGGKKETQIPKELPIAVYENSIKEVEKQ